MGYLLTFAILLLFVGLFILLGLPLLQRLGKQEPEVQRKWTDPVHSDKSVKDK